MPLADSDADSAMKPELTLIVAATRSMGIGLNGAMPWTGLRREMQYFARVTTRTAPESPPNAINAVIMGRKTWDSIPERFRPLRKRLNIVISRSSSDAGESEKAEQQLLVRVTSLEEAIERARRHPLVSRVFVMGGGQIYEQAMRRREARRVLLTSVEGDFACDTFFPDLRRDGGWTRCDGRAWRAWTGEEAGGEEGHVEEGGVRYQWQMWERE